ncbi:hypothetical protein A3Q56_05997 [Intoshia linei]|uniref:histone acetyltransferase n=1 Tax=Intoshia linei TaxID=1819745 RepID=A0A177AYM5_9BILA|nr:hypothetical protein A3Q56_05997 [Intoshia linei]
MESSMPEEEYDGCLFSTDSVMPKPIVQIPKSFSYKTTGNSVKLTSMVQADQLCSTGQAKVLNKNRTIYNRRLKLILHAMRCLQQCHMEERLNDCSVPYCNSMKNLLEHVCGCNDVRNCRIPHCYSTRLVILHSQECNHPACVHCMSLNTCIKTKFYIICDIDII